MSVAQHTHFVVRAFTCTFTPTGILVTCYTNNPCHLWLRWTNIIPQKHVNTTMVRGAPIGSYIDQCFVVYHDLEQNEAGDTILHTFTAEPWPSCETRWFYFWGNVNSIKSPSASALFSHHRHYALAIYSDPGEGLVTCDGFAGRHVWAETWTQVHDGLGNVKYPYAIINQCGIGTSPALGSWRGIYRLKMTFDLAAIPVGATILSAKYYFYLTQKTDTLNCNPTFALVSGSPAVYNYVTLADYQLCSAAPISDILSHPDMPINTWTYFTIQPQHLNQFPPGQKAGIYLREYNHDALDSPPPWKQQKRADIMYCSADYPGLNPYLYIEYTI